MAWKFILYGLKVHIIYYYFFFIIIIIIIIILLLSFKSYPSNLDLRE